MDEQKLNLNEKVVQFTTIAQAEDLPLAQDCVRLLEDNGIKSIIEDGESTPFFIKVEEGRFNEAYILIYSRITEEGFFDIYTEPQQTKDPNQAA